MGESVLRVGIAGAGWVARNRHAPAVLGRHDAKLVAVFDRDIGQARSLAEGTARQAGGRVTPYDSLAEFFGEGLDVVHVTSSPWSHHDLAIAAMAAGAHVFVEKPMAMDATEAEEMVWRAREASRLLCVSHNFLWSSAMTKALRELEGSPPSYVLGVQLSAMSRRLPSWHGELPGGLMFDEVPHMLYSSNRLLGGGLLVEQVRAVFDHGRCPVSVEVLLRGESGSGQVTMVFSSPVSEWHIVASGPARLVDIDLFRDIAVVLGPDGAHRARDVARTSSAAIWDHVVGFARSGARWATNRQFWGHDVLIGLFYQAVRGVGPLPVRVEDALQVVRATDAVLEGLGSRGRRP